MYKYKWSVSPRLCEGANETTFFHFSSTKFLAVALVFKDQSNENLLVIEELVVTPNPYSEEDALREGKNEIVEAYNDFIADDQSAGIDAIQNPPSFSEYCGYDPDIYDATIN